jgi:drug/metabolite transporter superfamily protein YnfA
MQFILGFLLIGIIGGVLIWLKTKRRKYVILFSIVMVLIVLLPWILLFLASASEAEFKD